MATPRHIPRHGAVAILACAAAIPSAIAADDAATSNARALLTQYRCYICHADREAVTGPAFADVAAQLRGRRSAASDIALQIRQGLKRGGPWHMPPHPEISPADANVMAGYIMSLDPARPSAPAVPKP